MHKHTTSIIAAVIRQRLRALLALGFLICVVGCVAEPDADPALDEPVASELSSVSGDEDLTVDEDLEDLEGFEDLDVEAADAAAGRCGFRTCGPGFFCCNDFCKRITPGVRCRDRSGRDTI